MSAFRCAAVLLLSLSPVVASAASGPARLDQDLRPQIREAAQHPLQYAVPVAQAVDVATDGTWSTTGGVDTWSYTLQVPDAVSLSFRAEAVLPAGAVLADAKHAYRSGDVRNGVLWSFVTGGDTLTLRLTLPSFQRRDLRLRLTEIQVGFKGWSSSQPTSAAYREVTPKATSTGCEENFECEVDDSNRNAGQATMMVTIKNAYQCTATLLSDVGGTGTPYALTAQHCDSPTVSFSDSADPADAQSMNFYFDSVTPCGQTLGSGYDGPAQGGATTAALAGDAWLLKLSAPPVVADAWMNGWDASGATFAGGFAVHHAGATSKQFTSYIGQPIVRTYSTTRDDRSGNAAGTVREKQWAVNTQKGSNARGASGGGLFDPAGRLVGSYSQYIGNAPQCPNNPATAPTANSYQYTFQQLSDVFSGSTSDPTATAMTIKAALDPGSTGTLMVDGMAAPIQPAPTLALATSAPTAVQGQSITLTWNSTNASACNASDQWSGPQAVNGTSVQTLSGTPQDGSYLIYKFTLTCNSSGGSATQAVTVNEYPPARLSFAVSPTSIMEGQFATLSWSGVNVSGCTAGGDWSGSRAASGSSQVQPAAGTHSYSLICAGNGGDTATQSATLTVAPASTTPPPTSPTSPTPAPAGGGSGGGSGGGPVAPAALLILAAAACARRRTSAGRSVP